jgi:putative tryptophan/tyrosine transport system substrate-binding protein
MRRRKFLAFIVAGTAAAAGSGQLQAQPARPRIGVLVLGHPEPFQGLFWDGLRQVGYVDGQNVEIAFRSAEGRSDLLPALAAELVRLEVAVIVAYQTPAARAAKEATTTVPVVMAGVGDPVGTGLVASLARPGGNVTGVSSAVGDLSAKLVELVREALPASRRIAVIANATDLFTPSFVARIEEAGRALGAEIGPVQVRAEDDFRAVMAEIGRAGSDALIVQGSLIRRDVADLAIAQRLPAFSNNKGFTEAGALMSYAANLAESYREAAVYVDKILKGSKPGDLPIVQPTKFELVVNLKTAKALGVTIPPTLLARADEVIE